MSPLFSRKPKLHKCFYCSDFFEAGQDLEHYQTHLVEVTDVNGDQAFTFTCPKCGAMDGAWGAQRHDPKSSGAIAMAGHLMMTHHIRLSHR